MGPAINIAGGQPGKHKAVVNGVIGKMDVIGSEGSDAGLQRHLMPCGTDRYTHIYIGRLVRKLALRAGRR